MSAPARSPAGGTGGGVWHAARAWTGSRFEPDVVLEVTGGRFARVEPGVAAGELPSGARHLPGWTLPGLANGHSHAFHRALRGRRVAGAAPGGEAGGGARTGDDRTGDFWGWRERMYALAGRLEPDSYERLARACFAEMALAGITVVGEFHYLHHRPGGRSYDDPAAMASGLARAAAGAGVRLTVLDALYLRGDLSDRPLGPEQRRFSDGDAGSWVARVAGAAARLDGEQARPGAAIHSVRAVDPGSMATVADAARGRGWPLHVHVSEQVAENDACQATHGCTPTALLDRSGVLGDRTTVVHATHATGDDLDLLAGAGSAVCLCPTTERDLADGIGPARAMAARGIPLALGSDSQAVIDPFEEARAVELDERLVSGTRRGLAPEVLLEALTGGGARSLGWPDAGRLAAGWLGDFVTVGPGSVRLAGTPAADPAAALVAAATAADVTDVVVGGREVVRDGRHRLVDDVPGALDAAVAAVTGADAGAGSTSP